MSHLISLVTPPGSGKMRIFCDTSLRQLPLSWSLLVTDSVSRLSLTGLSISPLSQCLSPVFTKRYKQVNTNFFVSITNLRDKPGNISIKFHWLLFDCFLLMVTQVSLPSVIAFLSNNSDPHGVSGARSGPGVTECKTERCCASKLSPEPEPGVGRWSETGPGERRDAGNESRASHPCNHNIRDNNAGNVRSWRFVCVFIVNKNGGSRIGK